MNIFAIGKPNKKADLSLSINAIVVVVLALTLLGLGLGFIKNIFKDITTTTGQISEQIRNQILEDLRTGNKKLSFSSTDVYIDKGASETLAIGVRNTNPIDRIKFTINVKLLQAKVAGKKYLYDETAKAWKSETGEAPESGVNLNIDFFYNEGPYELAVTEADVYPIKATAVGTAGQYMTKIEIVEGQAAIGAEAVAAAAKVYAEKTFFINIRS